MSPSSWYKDFMSAYGFDIGSCKPVKAPPGPAMDLANMRQNGVHAIDVRCLAYGCGHAATLNLDGYPAELPVKSFEKRMRCTACDGRKVEVRPAWR